MGQLTSKQRAQLRGLANTLQPIFQIGKEGVSKNMTDGIDRALEKRELLKVTILENADVDVRRTAERIAAATRAELVQCIGRRFVLYRESKERKRIEL